MSIKKHGTKAMGGPKRPPQGAGNPPASPKGAKVYVKGAPVKR